MFRSLVSQGPFDLSTSVCMLRKLDEFHRRRQYFHLNCCLSKFIENKKGEKRVVKEREKNLGGPKLVKEVVSNKIKYLE